MKASYFKHKYLRGKVSKAIQLHVAGETVTVGSCEAAAQWCRFEYGAVRPYFTPSRICTAINGDGIVKTGLKRRDGTDLQRDLRRCGMFPTFTFKHVDFPDDCSDMAKTHDMLQGYLAEAHKHRAELTRKRRNRSPKQVAMDKALRAHRKRWGYTMAMPDIDEPKPALIEPADEPSTFVDTHTAGAPPAPYNFEDHLDEFLGSD